MKSQIPIKILTTANSNDLNKSSVVLIKANQIDTEKLVGLAEKANAKIHALINYSGASDVLNLLQNLSNQGFIEGSYVFINIEDVGNINEIQSIYSNLRQGGYYVGLVNTVKGFASLDKDDVKNIIFYKMIDQDGDNSITVEDADGYINGSDVDLIGKLSQQPITRKERNTYTNVDVNTDSKGWVGIGQDTVLGGGKGFGYSTMGNDFNTVISPKGIIFRRPDAERMWELLKPKQQAEVSELLDHTVADEIKNQLPGLEKARQQADSAVKFAESAVVASKVNSDAQVAMNSAIAEAKATAESALSDVQQAMMNASSDAAQIRQSVVDVQNEVNTAKSANESAVKAVQDDLKSASASMDTIRNHLNSVATDLDIYAQSAAEQGHDITLIKQKQGQFEADFANAKGNVNQLQADMNGLRENIKDNQDNVASLLTSASKLQSSMTDAEKNISNLLLTASKYEQTFKDQDGRLSKIEQTATEHTGELADNKNNIDRVSQRADSLQVLLGNAQSNIQNIKLDAKGLHDTLTGQGNQLASLNITVNNFDSKYSGIIGDLKTKQTALTTEQQQTKDMLLRKADKSEVDNVKGTVNQVSAEQKTMADQIEQKASSTELIGALSLIKKNSTAIDENSKLISLMAKQTDVDNVKGTAQQLLAQFNVLAGEVKSKVDETKVNNIVDGKGYATTSTVQSLVDQKAGTLNESITKLDGKLTYQIQSVTASIDGLQSNVTNYKNDTSSRFTQLSNLMQSKVGTADFNNLKRSVDMQTLDSADINNMKTNGHYFVRNLANNPIGGWVYVDVTGNGNDRIRQDVYQDSGIKHKYRRWFGTYWTGWEEGATYTEINQLQNAVNVRVQKGELLSQINLTAGNTLIQSNKLYLDASSVVFSGRAFIPSAAISELDADKLTFYGNGSRATIGASVAQYDQDRVKSTINLQYDGGIEIHSSSQQGSILTMHDNTIRLASKSWGNNANPYQYSGFYAAPNYSLMNTYHKDGTTSGVAIDNDRIWIYGDSADQHNGSLQADVNWYSLNGKTGLLTGDQISLKAGNTQATLNDNNITINNVVDGNSNNYDVGIHIKGWAEMTGWFNCMGISQTSLLSTKTRIEPLDTKEALAKIVSADVRTYQFKTDVAKGKTKRHASVIIDDVHDVAEYYTPEEFISENRKGRDDGDIIGYLMGAVQELKKQLDKVKEKI